MACVLLFICVQVVQITNSQTFTRLSNFGEDNMNRNITKESGFTLIELMIVVAVMLILASAAVPASRTWTTNNRSRREVVRLFSRIKEIRVLAVTENVPFVVWFDVTNNQYRIFRNDDADVGYTFSAQNDTDILGGLETVTSVNMESATVSLAGGGNWSSAVFMPDGSMLNGMGGAVNFTSTGGTNYSVNLGGPTGNVSITSY